MAGKSRLDAAQKRYNDALEALREAKKADSKKERTARNHAYIVLMGIATKYIADGDWTQIDPQKWADYWSYYGTMRPAQDILEPVEDWSDANERIRAWQAAERAAKSRKKQEPEIKAGGWNDGDGWDDRPAIEEGIYA